MFVGIVFSLNISNISMLIRTALAFWVFCFLSSGVYLINDLHDLEKDRLHPVKRHRPLPSGRISINLAASLAALFLLVSLSSALILGNSFFVICSFYLIQSLLYTFYLRQIAIVDVIVIALGFVWRAIAGTVVILSNAKFKRLLFYHSLHLHLDARAPMATDKESATNAQAANPSRLQTNQSYTLQPIKLSQ